MNNSKFIFNHSIKLGLALGLTLSIFELLGYFLGILNQPIMSFMNIAIVISMLFISIKKYRDQIQGGVISFGNAFLLSFFISLISGAIWSVYRFIEYSMAPDIIKNLLVDLEEQLLKSSIGDDQTESLIKFYSIVLTPGILAISKFLSNMVFGGALLSLILASILKREENPMLTDSNQ